MVSGVSEVRMGKGEDSSTFFKTHPQRNGWSALIRTEGGNITKVHLELYKICGF